MIDRSIAPEIKMPSHLDLMKAEKKMLSNGLTVHCLNGCSEPVVNLSIMLKAGKYYQHKAMIASFALAMLKKGTTSKTALEIQEALDFYGASLNTSSNMFMASISLSCLTSKLIYVLPILTDLLSNAIFPEEELELEKNKQLQSLEINLEKNEFLASVKFNEFIFGKEHVCGKTMSIEQIQAVEREDLIEHYVNKINLNTESIIILSGDINQQTLDIIDMNLNSITLVSNAVTSEIPFKPEIEKIYHKTIKNSIQTSIRIGMPLNLKIEDQDFLDLEIVNRILGGYFGSRLMKNIREEKGYTYGIYSFVSNFLLGSYFCIATDVGVEYKESTINEISKEINRLKMELISEKELLMVKNYHKGSIMKRIDGSLRMANKLAGLLPLGLNEEYINQQLYAIENITAKRIQELSNKYLNFDEMYQVVVG